jgi:hypothetical protein
LGFAEYLKEQDKRVGERDAGERVAFLKTRERERDVGEKKKIREETCGGEGERKKKVFFF